jgi:hypothetical protein
MGSINWPRWRSDRRVLIIDFRLGTEQVNGVNCFKVATKLSIDAIQLFWFAEDIEGNVWQLQQFDGLTGETFNDLVLYMPANPAVGETYDLWDIHPPQYFMIKMKAIRSIIPTALLAVAVTLASGCATARKPDYTLNAPSITARTIHQAGLEIALDPFVERERTRRYFGINALDGRFHLLHPCRKECGLVPRRESA